MQPARSELGLVDGNTEAVTFYASNELATASRGAKQSDHHEDGEEVHSPHRHQLPSSEFEPAVRSVSFVEGPRLHHSLRACTPVPTGVPVDQFYAELLDLFRNTAMEIGRAHV